MNKCMRCGCTWKDGEQRPCKCRASALKLRDGVWFLEDKRKIPRNAVWTSSPFLCPRG